MDKWTPEQLKRMEHGGNSNARAFFEDRPDILPGMSIKDKYSSHTASLWREKLTTECEGGVWVEKPAANSANTLAHANSPSSSSLAGTPRLNGLSNAFFDSPSGHRSQTPDLAYGSNVAPLAATSQKQRNEDYFARLGTQNDTRRVDLPPNQGGKYTGFGSTPSQASPVHPTGSSAGPFNPQDIVNDPAAALSKGWSFLTMGAQTAIATIGTVAGSINDNYVRPAAEKIQNPEFRNDVSSYVSTIGSKVEETASRGFTSLSGYMRSGQAGYGGSGGNYSQVPTSTNALATDNDNTYDADFFESEITNNTSLTPPAAPGAPMAASAGVVKRMGSRSAQAAAQASKTSSGSTKKATKGWDDEWENF
ncbi:Zn finger-containing GTPase- Activating Protein for ARF [Coemansia sp. RSA 2320]|nr:Zn finger-containing GTPase- Activating Protein for ARF [Coemansia sp. RSA 2320]